MIISVTQFFQVQQAIKMHHWATSDYSLHVLLDDFYKDYSSLVDDIVEIVLGWRTNSIEVLSVEPFEAAFSDLESLLQQNLLRKFVRTQIKCLKERAL